jgi:hypothetical protein
LHWYAAPRPSLTLPLHLSSSATSHSACSTAIAAALGFMSPYNHSLLLLQVMGKSHTSIMVTAGMLAYAVVLRPCCLEPMHCPPAYVAPIGSGLRHHNSLSFHVEAPDHMILMGAYPHCPTFHAAGHRQRHGFVLQPGPDGGEKIAVMQGNTHRSTPIMSTPPPYPSHSFTVAH